MQPVYLLRYNRITLSFYAFKSGNKDQLSNKKCYFGAERFGFEERASKNLLLHPKGSSTILAFAFDPVQTRKRSFLIKKCPVKFSVSICLHFLQTSSQNTIFLQGIAEKLYLAASTKLKDTASMQ